MLLSRESVLKIARLARLELTEAEIENYQSRLGRVLEYIKDLEKLPVSEGFVRHVPADAVSMREDQPIDFPEPELLLKNAPDSEEKAFKLPPIRESDS